MLLSDVLNTRKYRLIAFLSSVGMLLLYPYIQVILNGGLYNYFFWFEVILEQSLLNFALYIAFSILFGIVMSMIIYSWKNRTCGLKGSVGSGGVGSTLAVLTSQCSACISLASLFLPIGAVATFAVYNTALNFVSIGALLLAIYLMKGFSGKR